VLSLCLVVLAALAVAAQESITIASRSAEHPKWIVERDAHPNEEIDFKILLKQRNLDQLNSKFWEVNDPKNVNYGKFLTKEEIAAMVGAPQESVKRVFNWLIKGGVHKKNIHVFSDFLQVKASVTSASKLFSTQFVQYRSATKAHLRILGDANIPAHLAEDIDFVAGISELITPAKKPATFEPDVFTQVSDDDGIITPEVLLNYYSVEFPNETSSSNLQGIAAFTDYFSLGALAAFDKAMNITGVNIKRVGPDCFPDSCDQYESDLDAQYMTALGRGVPTVFLAHGNGAWILDWALQLSTMSSPPHVNSVSYGWAELEECEITSGCQTYGYNSQQYVTRTDTELQKLGSMGLTILVSSGDDGAPSLGGSSGNCPMDPSTYCPTGGCNHTRSLCTELTITHNANQTDCFFPMGIETNACQYFLQDKKLQDALNEFAEKNSKCALAIESDRTQDPHLYSSCDCKSLSSTDSNGYTIKGYVFDQSNGAIFTGEYPTSSPYVTSVGATQFEWRNNQITSEIGCSIITGAKITTGGGFSSFQPASDYQTSAVSAYLSSGVGLPPSWSYNSSYRGYPDISFNGHNYLIVASNNTDDLDKCPCMSIPVDGTSCSSPSLAGLLSLINGELLAAGKAPLGFVNTLLYQMAQDQPDAYTDITSGSNRCNRSYCCLYGWEATTGWDPVGGLGSPVFSKMRAYIMQAKGL